MVGKKSRASVLLFVIVITSILSLLSLNYWYKSSLLFDLVLQREYFYKNFYITKTILNYGVGIIKKEFDNYLLQTEKQKLPITIDLNNFVSELVFQGEEGSFQGLKGFIKINRARQARHLFLNAVLQDKSNNRLCQLSCLLSKDENDAFIIKNNTIGDLV